MVGQSTAKRKRILYVAHRACGNPAFCAEVTAHAAAGAEVLVVAPVLPARPDQWMSDEAEERRVGGADDHLGQHRPLGARKVGQHVVGRIAPGRRAPDADADARESRVTERRDD